MQDKDFDKLFSSKFDDFESEPSPMVWDNIAGELDGKKGSRSWLTYLSIAATIAVVFTAGWLMLQKDNSGDNKHHNYANLHRKDTANSVAPQVTAPVVQQPAPAVIDRSSEDKLASTSKRQPKNIPAVVHTPAPVANKVEDAVKAPQPVVTPEPQLIAHNPAPVNAPIKPVMPDVQLSPKASDVIASVPVENNGDIASAEKQTEQPVKKRGIHNLGGLINALVAKVDKRPNKFIEFSDDEDDEAETSLTAVNMGPLKLKKQ